MPDFAPSVVTPKPPVFVTLPFDDVPTFAPYKSVATFMTLESRCIPTLLVPFVRPNVFPVPLTGAVLARDVTSVVPRLVHVPKPKTVLGLVLDVFA